MAIFLRMAVLGMIGACLLPSTSDAQGIFGGGHRLFGGRPATPQEIENHLRGYYAGNTNMVGTVTAAAPATVTAAAMAAPTAVASSFRDMATPMAFILTAQATTTPVPITHATADNLAADRRSASSPAPTAGAVAGFRASTGAIPAPPSVPLSE